MCAAVFTWLCLRSHGLMPAIFADEWYYSKMARLMPLREAIVPSYLYLWLFRSTNFCDTGFLDCVRYGNELFFVGAAPFIYLIARRVAGVPLALYVTLLALLAPLTLFVTFFMPEAMYYFGFAVLSWFVLVRSGRGWIHDGAGAGVILGLMTLVKVHALFLVPALCLYLLLAGWVRGEAGWPVKGIKAALLAVAAMVICKFGIGYLIAGNAGLSLFGPFYAGTANSNSGRPLLELLYLIFVSGKGHLMALVVLQGLPLAMIAQALFSRSARARNPPALTQVQLYTLLMLGSAAGLAAVYTASIAGAGPREVLRLHLRYYDFVFPLLLVIAAAAIGVPARDGAAPRLRWALAALLGVVLLLAGRLLPLYAMNLTDGPDIATLELGDALGWRVIGFDLLILALWAQGNRLAAPLFLFLAVPLMTWLAQDASRTYLATLNQDPPPARAGRLAHRHVPPEEHGSITVAGTDIAQIMRAQFSIDLGETGMLDLLPDAPIEPYQIPLHQKWLLVFGKHKLPDGFQPFIATEDYALVKIARRWHSLGVTDVTKALPNGPVADIEGLSHLESWGRWSDGKHVVLHLRAPLPAKAVLILKAQAYGPNAGLPFTLHVGGQEQRFLITAAPQSIALPLTTDGAQRTVVIDVPRPTAPNAVGPSIDFRELGVGLSGVEIAIID
jgi:phosphoglycerol transferase